MYPFEVWDEHTQRVEFYWNLWWDFKQGLFRQYPITPKDRVELSIGRPCDHLEQISVHWNPHVGVSDCGPHDCFYDNARWSSIFDIYPTHNAFDPHERRFFMEWGHHEPWGEPVRLMSTSSDWTDNYSIRYVYFRGQYWLVTGFLWHAPQMRFDFRNPFPVFPRMNNTWNVQPLRRTDEDMVDFMRWTLPLRRRYPTLPMDRIDWLREGF